MDILSQIHFLNCRLINFPFDSWGICLVLVVHKYRRALLLRSSYWSSAACLLALDVTVIWMGQLIAAVVGALSSLPYDWWLAVIFFPAFLRSQIWTHQSIMLAYLSKPSGLRARTTSSIHHISNTSSCGIQIAILLRLATYGSWLEDPISCVVLCTEILEIEVEILLLRSLSKDLIVEIGVLFVMALDDYLIDIGDALQIQHRWKLFIKLEQLIWGCRRVMYLDHILIEDLQDLAQ